MDSRLRRLARWAPLCAAVALLAACVGPPGPDQLLEPGGPGLDEATPLGGASLDQRRSELERAHQDLIRFRDTYQTLRARRDRGGQQQFKTFLEDYLQSHLDPLLRAEWISDHPELLGLDANIRLYQAELFMLMGDRHRMERVVEQLEERFAEREDLLVDYPAGRQSTLREALDILARRKWWG